MKFMNLLTFCPTQYDPTGNIPGSASSPNILSRSPTICGEIEATHVVSKQGFLLSPGSSGPRSVAASERLYSFGNVRYA